MNLKEIWMLRILHCDILCMRCSFLFDIIFRHVSTSFSRIKSILHCHLVPSIMTWHLEVTPCFAENYAMSWAKMSTAGSSRSQREEARHAESVSQGAPGVEERVFIFKNIFIYIYRFIYLYYTLYFLYFLIFLCPFCLFRLQSFGKAVCDFCAAPGVQHTEAAPGDRVRLSLPGRGQKMKMDEKKDENIWKCKKKCICLRISRTLRILRRGLLMSLLASWLVFA